MRGFTITALVIATVGLTAPASADAACANDGGLEVITPAGLTSSITTPSLIGNESEFKEFLLDLSPAGSTATAKLTVTMTWNYVVNDYDLTATSSLGSFSSEGYQPVATQEAEEVATIDAANCDTIFVDALDYLAPVVVDELSLAFTVSDITG